MGPHLNRGYVYRERITDGGATLLAWLTRRYLHSTEAAWRARIDAGEVTLDGAPASAETVLVRGTALEWRRPPWLEPDVPEDWTTLHRDAHVLAVLKPAGLPTLPGGGYLDHTLLGLVRRDVPGATPVHRLGRWTSGVVLFALSATSRNALGAALREGTMAKRYRALASGTPPSPRWTVATPIGPVPHALLGTVHGASPDGRAAHTEVTVLEARENAFLADVTIATGRPHQIRIHLAASGHPLLGDPLYGPGGLPIAGTTALPGDPGYALHAAEVRVRHPGGAGELRVIAAPPPVLRAAGETG